MSSDLFLDGTNSIKVDKERHFKVELGTGLSWCIAPQQRKMWIHLSDEIIVNLAKKNQSTIHAYSLGMHGENTD